MSKMSKSKAEEILGLSGTYDSKKLRDTYRKLAAKNHPDAVAARGGNVDEADAKMKEINAANAFLQVLVKSNVTLTAGVEPGADKQSGYSVYNGGKSSTDAGTQQSNKTYTTYSTKQGTQGNGTTASNGQSRWAAYTAAGQNAGAAAAKPHVTEAKSPEPTMAQGTYVPRTRTSADAKEPTKQSTVIASVINILKKAVKYIPLRPFVVWFMFSNLYTWMVSMKMWDNFLNWSIEIPQYMTANPFIFIPLGLLGGLLCLIELATGLITKIIKTCIQWLLSIIGAACEAAASK